MSTPGSEAPAPFTCRNCGRRYESEAADYHGWCAACRQALVRRATTWAYAPTALVAVLLVAVVGLTVGFYSRFLIALLALVGLLAFGVFKVARRVLFDVFRGRGVPVPGRQG